MRNTEKGTACQLATCMLLIMGSLVTARAAETERVYLSGRGPSDAVEWEFICSAGRRSGEWTTIPVPSNWEQHGFGGYDYGHVPRSEKHHETGHYRTTFFAPEAWKGKVVRLVFEGAMTDTSIRINGTPVGPLHQGGYTRFHYLLTDTGTYGQHAINFGTENQLDVLVAKRSADASLEAAERQADYWVFGGIYRPVYLEVMPKAFINRVAIDAGADGFFRMDVFPQVHLPRGRRGGDHVDEVFAQIETLAGEPVGQPMTGPLSGGGAPRVRLQTRIEEPTAWSPEFPNLYQVRVALKLKGETIHEMTQRFGFRTFERRIGDGLYLNGKKIMMRGVNRNTFRPDTARSIDADEAWADAKAIKEMNGNAVRCHLPPTQAFMEACDELGLLYVLERTNWQRPVADTAVSRLIVHELVAWYQNHPSLVLWANGNEGGFNHEVDELFPLLDLQQRPVIHPWAAFDGIDTHHYPDYSLLTKKLSTGDTLYLPTELLHGLYDGGHGAGLEDYWSLMRASSLGAGGFLWCWADAAIERTDLNGELDTDGNHSADGIVGPYGEKEASYYTIREIWSPIQITLEHLPDPFDGTLPVENRFHETDLAQCAFTWRLLNVVRMQELNIIAEGKLDGPAIPPGKMGTLMIPLDGKRGDILEVTAIAPTGREIMRWSWPLRKTEPPADSSIQPVPVDGNLFHIRTGSSEVRFSDKTGQLIECVVDGKPIEFRNGPVLYAATQQGALDFSGTWETSAEKKNGSILIQSENRLNGSHFSWIVKPGGILELNYSFAPITEALTYCAVGFDLDEHSVVSKRWLGNGPFRVWNNRMKGPRFGLWEDAYNDGIAGERWQLPEFKGVFSGIEWMQLDLNSGAGLLLNPDYGNLGVLRPVNGAAPRNAVWAYPEKGGLFIFHKIPAIGTKFKPADALGPQSVPGKLPGPIQGTVSIQIQ